MASPGFNEDLCLVERRAHPRRDTHCGGRDLDELCELPRDFAHKPGNGCHYEQPRKEPGECALIEVFDGWTFATRRHGFPLVASTLRLTLAGSLLGPEPVVTIPQVRDARHANRGAVDRLHAWLSGLGLARCSGPRWLEEEAG